MRTRRSISTTVLLIRLFVVSYVPLAGIVAVRSSEDVCFGGDSCSLSWQATVFWVAVAWCVAGLIEGFRLPRLVTGKGSVQRRFHDVQDEGASVAAYLATYLLPFLGATAESWRDAAALLIYGGALLVVFLRSNMPLVNPTLYLMGYQVVGATVDEPSGSRRTLLLCRRDQTPTNGEPCSVVPLGDFFISKADNDRA